MALRLNSLKTRTALAITLVVVATLVTNAVYLILSKRAELRKDIETRAELFAKLSRAPICVGFDTYYSSGVYKFRELMRDHLRLNDDVERILIVDVNGRILFDSRELDEGEAEPRAAQRAVTDPVRLENIKKLEVSFLRTRDERGAERLEIIAPYIEDWGRHRLSVLYYVSYRNLRPGIVRLVYTTAGLTLASILLSILVAMALATRITRPLEELTGGAQGIAEGHFDRRLAIRSNDEIQILAETFNYMTERLKENVEQLEESNKKLAMVNEELKELDRMKSDLLANVSHELRTPLTAIKGYTDYILDRKLGPITDKQEKGLLVVQRNLERLSKSINALLDFSRMDVGRIALNIQPFGLPQLVDSIAQTLRSELEKKRLLFRAALEPGLPAVIADREKISQVLENLVINALKFTPEGGRLTLRAVRVQAGGRPAVEISVSDTGIGIPQDQLAKIFNRFHQVDGSTTRRFGGVGLGLAIVKSILDAHGAAIAVESEERSGTTFRFVLPLLDKAEAREERAPAAPAPAVLLLDEDPEFLRAAQGQLEEEGVLALASGTGPEAAALVARRRPDLVLLGLAGDGGGLALLRALREDPETRRIPLLAAPAREGSRALAVAVAGCLLRPPGRAPLLARARRAQGAAPADGPGLLIVVGETAAAAAVRDAFAEEGLQVAQTEDAAQTLAALERERPELVVLDLAGSGATGLAALEAVARGEHAERVPLAVLAGAGDEADGRGAREADARRGGSGPCDVGALLAEVRRRGEGARESV